MTPVHHHSRRRFLQKAAAASVAGFTVPQFMPSAVLHGAPKVAANSRVNIGMIGMGRQAVIFNVKQFMNESDAQVVAVCDVDRWRLDHGKKIVEDHYAKNDKTGSYKGCAAYGDFRELLARDDIDAVMITTPDHWHVPISLEALRAGKHVCCEKPLTRSIAEGRTLSDEVKKQGLIFRTDSEFRSMEAFHRACELVRNGRVGKLHTIRAGVPDSDLTCPPQPVMPIPEDLDYKAWLGPAPSQPYTEKRVHPHRDFGRGGWMRVRDYCDGLIANWGAHLLDIAQWGHGTDRTGPVEVRGTGEYPPQENLWNVLLKFEVEYKFADGVKLFYKSDKPYVRFEGSEGWLYVEYPNVLKAEPASILTSTIGADELHLVRKREKRDFLDAIHKNGDVMADAEIGHRTASMCHLGQIAVQTGRKLKWNPQTEQFTGDDAANRLLNRPLNGRNS